MTSTRDGTGEKGTPGSPPARSGSVTSRRTATTRVLVVEDEHDIADFLRAYFRASGYDLLHVDPNGPRHVLARVREARPDCVLLDVRLRGFSGFDAYRLIREDPELDLTPVVLVTADASAQVRAVGVAAGLDGYVGKPFNVKALEQLVAERIARARALRDSGRRDTGVAGEAYLQARLRDEVAAAAATRTAVGFALARLIGLPRARREAGDEAADYAEVRVQERLRDRLPAGTILGAVASGELAVILASDAVDEAEALLRNAMGTVAPTISLPGGARVVIEVASGLAMFPDHATTADELWMAADAALADASEAGGGLVVAR